MNEMCKNMLTFVLQSRQFCAGQEFKLQIPVHPPSFLYPPLYHPPTPSHSPLFSLATHICQTCNVQVNFDLQHLRLRRHKTNWVRRGGRGATAEWQREGRRKEGGRGGGQADCVASGLAATRRMIDDAKVHKLPKRNKNKMN